VFTRSLTITMAYVDMVARGKVDNKLNSLDFEFNGCDWLLDDLGDLLDEYNSKEGWTHVCGGGDTMRTIVDYVPDLVDPAIACELVPDIDVGCSAMLVEWEKPADVKELCTIPAPSFPGSRCHDQEVVVQENLHRYRPDVGVRLLGRNWNETKILHQMISVSSWTNLMLDHDRLLFQDLLKLEGKREVGAEISMAIRFLTASHLLRSTFCGTFSAYHKVWKHGGTNRITVELAAASTSGYLYRACWRSYHGGRAKARAWMIKIPGAGGRAFGFVPARARVRSLPGQGMLLWTVDPDRDYLEHEDSLVAPVRVHAKVFAERLSGKCR